jgi:hypothetical protein
MASRADEPAKDAKVLSEVNGALHFPSAPRLTELEVTNPKVGL